MRDPVPPPPDFVAFVAGHLDRLHAAALVLRHTDPAARALATDLFAAAAARWATLRRRDAGDHRAAADYVGELFRREAALAGPSRHRPRAVPAPPAERVAAAAWAQARGARRRRALVGAAAMGALVAAVLLRPGAPVPFEGTGGTAGGFAPASASPSAPQHLPRGLDVLPPPDRLPYLRSPLPDRIPLAEPVGSLKAHPVPYALAAFRPAGGPLLLLGPDGRLRSAPEPGAPVDSRQVRLPATALSGDGRSVAQLTADGLSVLDVVTGRVARFPATEWLRWVTWLDARRLLVGGLTGSVQVDLAAGRVAPTTAGARTTLTPRGDAAVTGLDGALELLPVGEPATAPARLRVHVTSDEGVRPLDTALSGHLMGWVGPWRGGGYATGTLALRDCTPTGTLPTRYGVPARATAAVDPASGVVFRMLVATGEADRSPQLLGVVGDGVALVRADGAGGVVHVVGWRAATGALYRLSTVELPTASADVAMSLADFPARG